MSSNNDNSIQSISIETIINYMRINSFSIENYSNINELKDCNNPNVLFLVGFYHGLNKDYEKAQCYYERASKLGHLQAKFEIGKMIYFGLTRESYSDSKIQGIKQMINTYVNLNITNLRFIKNTDNNKTLDDYHCDLFFETTFGTDRTDLIRNYWYYFEFKPIERYIGIDDISNTSYPSSYPEPINYKEWASHGYVQNELYYSELDSDDE